MVDFSTKAIYLEILLIKSPESANLILLLETNMVESPLPQLKNRNDELIYHKYSSILLQLDFLLK